MVSSFVIITNIKVDKQTAEDFNDISENNISLDIKSKLPAYFDSSSFDDLDYFLSNKNISNGIWLKFSNWRFDKNYRGEYVLIDSCEKFHGAISYLHYFIETFFEPRGIKLNGTVVGVNTEMPIAYVYDISNNTISLNEIATRKVLDSYDLCYKDELLYRAFDVNDFTKAVFDKYKM
jgi:hypothetical protein